MSADQGQRLHGIDALRAIAMILGMLLHATIAYKVEALPNWPHDDEFHHWTFDFLYHSVHSFRMPLFFLIAGYFSRLLYHKLGERAFIRHRLKRIFVPFVFSLFLILPFTIYPFSVYRYSTIYPGQWDLIFSNSFRDLFHWNGMAHLWFLYYLLIYYAVVIAVFRIGKMSFLREGFRRVESIITYFKPSSYVGIAMYTLLVWLTLLMSSELYLHVDTGIIPGASYLTFYAVFFLMGWLVNKKAFSFDWISERFWPFIISGSLLCVMLFVADFHNYVQTGWQFALIKLLVAVQIILLMYGVIGFFLRYCQSENNLWRYVSDASYWMYLIHLGIIAGLQIWLMDTPVPGFVRFLVVLVIPLLISLLTYHYFVRYTILGTYLHGKRVKPAKG